MESIYTSLDLHKNNIKGARVQEEPLHPKDIVNKEHLERELENLIQPQNITFLEGDILLCQAKNFDNNLNELSKSYKPGLNYFIRIIISLKFNDRIIDSNHTYLDIIDGNNNIITIQDINTSSVTNPLFIADSDIYKYFEIPSTLLLPGQIDNNKVFTDLSNFTFKVRHIFNETTDLPSVEITRDLTTELFNHIDISSNINILGINYLDNTLPTESDFQSSYIGSIPELYISESIDYGYQFKSIINKQLNRFLVFCLTDNEIQFDIISFNISNQVTIHGSGSKLLETITTSEWNVGGAIKTVNICILDLGYIDLPQNIINYYIRLK